MSSIKEMGYIFIILIAVVGVSILGYKNYTANKELAECFEVIENPTIISRVDTFYTTITDTIYKDRLVIGEPEIVYVDTNKYFSYKTNYQDSILSVDITSVVSGELIDQSLIYSLSIPEITKYDSVIFTKPPITEYVRDESLQIMGGVGINNYLEFNVSAGANWGSNTFVYSYMPTQDRITHNITYLKTIKFRK